jgi:hypothetical protein
MDVSGRGVVSTTRPRRAATVATIALAVVLVAVGCGRMVAGSTGSTTPMPATEAMAYTATMNANSADAYVTTTFFAHNHKLDETSTESGPVSWSANQGELETTMTMNGQEWMAARQIIDEKHIYTRVLNVAHLPASSASGIPGLSGWEETTWSGASSGDQSQVLLTLLLVGPMSPEGLANPASLLALLRARASSIENLGGAVLNGISTTHYRAFIPLSHLGPISPAVLKRLEQVLGSSFMSFDYWIDPADLLRQLRLIITINRPRQPTDTPSSPGEVTLPISYPITFSTSLQLSDYGTPVHIVLPPPSQITSQGSCVVSPDGFNCTS